MHFKQNIDELLLYKRILCMTFSKEDSLFENYSKNGYLFSFSVVLTSELLIGHHFNTKSVTLQWRNAKSEKTLITTIRKYFLSFWFQLHCQNIDRRSKTRFTCYWIISAFSRRKSFHTKERKRFHKQKTTEELC